MTIQISFKRNDWVFDTGPRLWPYADTASAACPAPPGSLAMTSITFADVICDVLRKYCKRAWIVLHNVTSEYLSAFVFLKCGSNSEFLRWQVCINEPKWTVLPSFRASSITFFLGSDFVSGQAGSVSSFSHSLSTAAFVSGIFIALGTGINLCTRLQWFRELIPSPAICSSWSFGWDPSNRLLADSSASAMHSNFVLQFPLELQSHPVLAFYGVCKVCEGEGARTLGQNWEEMPSWRCEGDGDVVGVEAPLGGVAQVIVHGVQVVEVGVQVRVHQDRGVEEERRRSGWSRKGGRRGQGATHIIDDMQMEWRTQWTWAKRIMTNHQDRRRLNSALYVPCSLVQLARVVIVRVILVDVIGVMVVLIGHDTVAVVGAVIVAIFVVIFL